jgi:uncharacterized Tic20 family protein
MNAKQRSLRITGTYALFGCLWILFSDKLSEAMIRDLDMVIIVSMINGWFYVLITALLIYSLAFSAIKRVKESEEELYRGMNNVQ